MEPIHVPKIDKPKDNPDTEAQQMTIGQKLARWHEWLDERWVFRVNEITQSQEANALDDTGNLTEWVPLDTRLMNTIISHSRLASYGFGMERLKEYTNSLLVESYHPIRQYLAYLKQSVELEKGYIQAFASTLTPSKQVPEIQGHVYTLLRRWLVSAIAQWSGRGGVAEVMLVFRGRQGIGKTRWIKSLVPKQFKEYYYDGAVLSLLTNKAGDLFDIMAENALINIDDELDTFDFKHFAAMKNLLTNGQVKNRKAYAINAVRRNRIGVFLGTVNRQDFLRDTEHRRYLVIECERINHEHGYDIDKVWREALYLYESGEGPFYTKEEKALIAKINERYAVSSVEQDLLGMYFEPAEARPAKDDAFTDYVFYTKTEILRALQSKFTGGKKLNLTMLSLALEKLDYWPDNCNGNGRFTTSRYGYWVRHIEPKSPDTDKAYF